MPREVRSFHGCPSRLRGWLVFTAVLSREQGVECLVLLLEQLTSLTAVRYINLTFSFKHRKFESVISV